VPWLLLPILVLSVEGVKLSDSGSSGEQIDVFDLAGDLNELGGFEDAPAALVGERLAISDPPLELSGSAGVESESGITVSVDSQNTAPLLEDSEVRPTSLAKANRFLAPRPANSTRSAHVSSPNLAKTRSEAGDDRITAASGQLPISAIASVDSESSMRGSVADLTPMSMKPESASFKPAHHGDIGHDARDIAADIAASAALTNAQPVGSARDGDQGFTGDGNSDMVLAAQVALYGSDQPDERVVVESAPEEANVDLSQSQNSTAAPEGLAGSKDIQNALNYIHGRLATSKSNEALLRKKLIAALRWGDGVKQELATSREQLTKQKDAAARALAQKDSVDHAALTLEQYKGGNLELRLNQSQAELSKRGVILARMRHELSAAQKELAIERASWQAREEQMQRDISKEKQQTAAREATIRSLVAEKTAAANEHISLRRKDAEALQRAKAEAAKMKDVAVKTGRILKRERARSKTLQELVEVNKHKVVEYMGEEKQLRTDLSSANSASHNVTLELQDALQRQQGLLRERDHLVEELQTNASESSNLSTQVAQLRHRLAEEQKARSNAEAAAKKAESEKNAAQAIARQLSAVMPQLLEQAETAREACDANKTMKAQKIQDLKQQYTSIIQTEQEQLQNMMAKAAMDNPNVAPATAVDPNDRMTAATPDVDTATDSQNEDMTLVMEDSQELDKLAPADQDGGLADDGSS